MVGAHEAVPEIEVDAVVAAHFFVMHRVVGGGIEEKLQWSFHEPAGVNLVAGVSKDVVGKLPHHEDCEGEIAKAGWIGIKSAVSGKMPAWTKASAGWKE